MTVNSLFNAYMETKELADTTRINYVKMWNNHVRDEIGNIKVVQLRPSHVKAFYAKLSRQEKLISLIRKSNVYNVYEEVGKAKKEHRKLKRK